MQLFNNFSERYSTLASTLPAALLFHYEKTDKFIKVILLKMMELESNSLRLSHTYSFTFSILQIHCKEQLLAVEKLFFAFIISVEFAVNH